MKFEIDDPEFQWSLRPGKVQILDEYNGDFLFGINHPSESQHKRILEFFQDKEPDSYKFFYGYSVNFVCGLMADLETPKRERDHTYDVTCFANVRTSHGVEFKLTFAEWF